MRRSGSLAVGLRRSTGSLGPATAALDALLASSSATAPLGDVNPATAALEALASTGLAMENKSAATEALSGKKRRKKRTLNTPGSKVGLGLSELFDAVCADNNEQAFPSIGWDHHFDHTHDADELHMQPPPAKKPNSSPSLGLTALAMMRSPTMNKSASGGRLTGLSRSRSSKASLGRVMSNHFDRNI